MQRLLTDEEIWLEPDDKPPVATCSVCGGEIYDGEIYGKDDMGNAVCRDCLNKEWSRLQVDEKFEMLGYEVVT